MRDVTGAREQEVPRPRTLQSFLRPLWHVGPLHFGPLRPTSEIKGAHFYSNGTGIIEGIYKVTEVYSFPVPHMDIEYLINTGRAPGTIKVSEHLNDRCIDVSSGHCGMLMPGDWAKRNGAHQ